MQQPIKTKEKTEKKTKEPVKSVPIPQREGRFRILDMTDYRPRSSKNFSRTGQRFF